MRMRVSGSDNSNSEYRHTFYERNNADTTNTIGNGNTATSIRMGTYARNNFYSEISISNPFSTKITNTLTQCSAGDNTNSRMFYSYGSGCTTVTTSYTGFTVLTDGATMTGGTIRVYGVNQ
jgi:hypothetical protein